MYQRKCLLSVFLAIFFFVNLLPVYAANQNLPATGTYPQTLAKAAVLMDASSGRVLYESNAHQRLSPASVTKIMTALLVAEQGNLEQKVTISQNAADTPESSVWLEPGEKLTRRQLLYACMLNSANDAAVALAESVAGSEQDFVQLMNRRARQLGMKDSHFGNPHGLETAGHYTSAYDLALLSREALTNKIFRQVVATQSTKIPWTGKEYDRLLVNQNRLLYRYDGAIGVKTGYTKQAGNCVVGAAQRGSLVLIAVVMNSPSVYPDLEQMLDYGFANYSKVTLKKAGQITATVPVENGLAPTVKATTNADLTAAVLPEEKSQLSYKVYPLQKVTAPVKKGQVLGTCKMYINGQQVGKADLLASFAVNPQPPLWTRIKTACFSILKTAAMLLVLIFALLYLIRLIRLRNLRRRRKRRVIKL